VAERIDIVIDDSGSRARVIQRDLDQISDRSERAGRRITGVGRALRAAFAGLTIGFLVREVFQLSDAFVSLENRTRIALDGLGDVNGTLDELFAIANRTRGPVEQIVELFQRGSIASAELGTTQAELLRFVEAVSQGLAIQGGAAGTSSGALLQLSQALGSGIVRAEEFNSILEGAFPIAQAAARGLDAAGGSVARLRTLVIEGKVSSDAFFRAILSQSEELEATFRRTNPTIGQALTVLRNSVLQQFRDFTETTGLVAQGIQALAGNVGALVDILGNLTRAATAAGAALLVAFGPAILRAITGYTTTLLTAIARNIELRTAVATGNAIIIGSEQAKLAQALQTATVEAQAAAATVASAEAEVAATAATLARVRAENAKALIVAENGAAAFALAAVDRQLLALEAQQAAAVTALTAARNAATGATLRQAAAQEALNGASARGLGVVTSLRAALSAARAAGAGLLAALATPTGIAVGIGAAAAALVAFREQIPVTQDGLVNLGQFGQAAFLELRDGVTAALRAIADSDAVQALRAGFRALGETVTSFVQSVAGQFPELMRVFSEITEGITFSLEGLLRASARIIDTLVGLFRGARAAIQRIFEQLGDSIVRILAQSLNFVIGLVETTVNQFNAALSPFLELSGFDPIARIDLGRLETGASEAGLTVAQAFDKALEESTGVEDLLDRVLATARKIALEERGAIPAPAAQRVDPNAFSATATASTGPTFDDIIRAAETEADLLQLTNRERVIQEGLLAAEQSLKRSLTPIERQLLETQIRQNLAFEERNDLLEELRRPQDELNLAVEEYSRLLNLGLIDQEQYNRALDNAARSILGDTRTELERLSEDLESYNAALQAGAIDQDEFNRLVSGAVLGTRNLGGALDDLSRSTTRAFGDFLSGSQSASGALKQLERDIQDIILRVLVLEPLTESLREALASTVSGGGIIGDLLGLPDPAAASAQEAASGATGEGSAQVAAAQGAAASAQASATAAQTAVTAAASQSASAQAAAASSQSSVAAATSQSASAQAAAATSQASIAQAVAQASAAQAAAAAAQSAARLAEQAALRAERASSSGSAGGGGTDSSAASGAFTSALTTAIASSFAEGGVVRGPGGPRDDLIPALLSNGEFVVNADAVRRFRPLLEAINSQRLALGGMVEQQRRMDRPVRLQTGGFVGSLPAVPQGTRRTTFDRTQPSRERPMVVNFNVQTPDVTSFQRSEGQILARIGAGIQRARRRDG